MASSDRLHQFRILKNPLQDTSLAKQSQTRRRQEALERQRQDRQTAFSLTRRGLDEIVQDLDISEESGDEVDATSPGGHLQGNRQGHPPKSAKGRLPQQIKRKWRAHADRLMMGEPLDMTGDNDAEGVPEDLFENWLALGPVPKGKRCLAVTFPHGRVNQRGRVTNTLLLARTSGRPLSRHFIPSVPPDCILDCVYLKDTATLYILDVLRWKSQSIAECEADFSEVLDHRMFWRDSKFSELGPQPLISPSTTQDGTRDEEMADNDDAAPPSDQRCKPHQLLVVPVPCLSAPLSVESLNSHLVDHGNLPIHVLGQAEPTSAGRLDGDGGMQTITLQYQVDGLLLLLKDASYESGLTPLAAWVGREDFERFGTLLLAANSKRVE